MSDEIQGVNETRQECADFHACPYCESRAVALGTTIWRGLWITRLHCFECNTYFKHTTGDSWNESMRGLLS